MRSLLACILLAGTLAAQAAVREDVVTIPTRQGVTVSYLLVREAEATPKVVVVTLIGGTGAINLATRAAKGPVTFGPGANFLIRARSAFADADFADAIVDAPSDQLPDGMRDEFRAGALHAADMRAVAADLHRRFPEARLYLVGTSRGTISAANLAIALADVVQGAVLSSTVTRTDRMGAALSGFDFSRITIPVLLLHHHDDACNTSPYSGAEALAKRFPLVTAHGGDPPQSVSCDPRSPHGYFGLDAPVTAALKAWMRGAAVPHDVP